MESVYGPGTPGSARHPEYLLALGSATYEAAKVAMIATDLMRVLGGVADAEMYGDPLGRLEGRVRGLIKTRSDVDELIPFLEKLTLAREHRNDLIHALPVHDGLYRRTAEKIREFFTVESLEEVAAHFAETYADGLRILYRNDGKEVDAWYGRDDA